MAVLFLSDCVLCLDEALREKKKRLRDDDLTSEL